TGLVVRAADRLHQVLEQRLFIHTRERGMERLHPAGRVIRQLARERRLVEGDQVRARYGAHLTEPGDLHRYTRGTDGCLRIIVGARVSAGAPGAPVLPHPNNTTANPQTTQADRFIRAPPIILTRTTPASQPAGQWPR